MSDISEQVALDLLTKGWDGFLSGMGRPVLEAALPGWLVKQRWFGAKTRKVARLEIGHWVLLPVSASVEILPSSLLQAASSLGEVLLFVDLTYVDGSEERYLLPLAYAAGAELEALRQTALTSILMEVNTPTGPGAFHDALVLEAFRQALLELVERGVGLAVEDSRIAAEHVAATLIAAHESRPAHEVAAVETVAIAGAIKARHSIHVTEVAPQFVGHMPGAVVSATANAVSSLGFDAGLRGVPSLAFAMMRGQGNLSSRIGSAEQSNTNILYGKQILMKMFRRLQQGINPDIEIGRFLTEAAKFDRIAPFLGEVTLLMPGGAPTSLAMVQGLVANEGDGWEWTQNQLQEFFAAAKHAGDSPDVAALASESVRAAALLGQRTAEMHLALATPTTDAAFAAETFTEADYAGDSERIATQITAALDALRAARGGLPEEVGTQAVLVLAQRAELLARAKGVRAAVPSGERIRIHGDYHLGQVLRADEDFVLLDFEGEPAKSLAERRRKQSPLRDVAGMLRSFSYAAASALQASAADMRAQRAPWARAWEKAVCESFLASYLAAASASETLLPEPVIAQSQLQGYLLEKALYELLYELNNRPAWVGIPLAGILNFSSGPDAVLS